MSRASWKPEDVEILKRFYPIRTAKEMEELLPNYTPRQINRKAKYEGLSKMKEVRNRSRLEASLEAREDLWTDEEKRIVIDVYPTGGAKAVQELLPNRSIHLIKKVAYRLGVTREVREPVYELESIKLVDSSMTVKAKFKRR